MEVGTWILNTKEFKDFSPYIFMGNWIISISINRLKVKLAALQWIPPHEGSLKLNFDGTSKGNLVLGVCVHYSGSK